MKIVHCLNHYLPESIGGTEVYSHNLAKVQQRDGDDVIILVPAWGENEEWTYENIHVMTFPVEKDISREVRAGHKPPEGINEFLEKLALLQPDIIHFHEFTQGNGVSYHHVLAAAKHYKVIVTLHLAGYTCKTGELMYKGKEACDGVALPLKCTRCMYVHRELPVFKANILNLVSSVFYRLGHNTTNWHNSVGTALGFPFQVKQAVEILKRVAKASVKIVILNNWYREILVRNGIPVDKIITIQQGLVHEDIIVKNIKDVELPLRLVYLGRIAPIKGLHLLLEAMNGSDPAKVLLDIYGKENADDYNRQCRGLSEGSQNITWKGSIPSGNVISTLSGYHVLVLPSLSEMSSLVIPEAFAAGLPVLASSIAANSEMVQEGRTGWFFKFNDASDLRNKIENLVSNPGQVNEVSKTLPANRNFNEIWNEYRLVYNAETGNV